MPAANVTPVFLAELALRDFRNHRMSRLQPGQAPFVVLSGANGAGKTNILEAASLLAVGRGLRSARLAEMAAADGAGGFRVQAELLPDPALPAIGITTFTTADAPERRQLQVNGASARLAALSDWSGQLWLTPAMDRLFTDSAGARRRFLDRLVLALAPAHARHASRYEAAMRARNRLLQEAAPDGAWLDALESEMATHGSALAAARRQTIDALAATLAASHTAGFPRPQVALADPVDAPAATAGAALRQLLQANRRRDAGAGRALIGPHRTDLQVLHAAKQLPAALASTGEQKALLIAILLAHARLVAQAVGRAPLLLLDEVAAHLDADRRQALYAAIAALGSQAWLTGTDSALFAGLDAACFAVAGGRVQAV